MTKEIKIGGVPVKFCGNAATTFRYKSIFKRDILKDFIDKGTDIDLDEIIELAYVLKLQAEGYTNEQLAGIGYGDFVAWLETMDFLDLMNAAPEILSVWVDTNKQMSKAKKK